MPAAFDTLEIAKRLRNAGFDEAQAEAVTGVLRDAREADLSQLATKADLSQLEARLTSEFAALRSEMEILRRDLTIRLGGMIFVATGILLAAKFFG
jgi:Protein of unknown function (DUF1640)